MGRLADKLKRANDAMDRFHVDTERAVDALVDRVDMAGKRRDAAFMRKHEAFDGHMTDIAEFEKDLEAFDGKNDLGGAGENTAEDKAAWQPKS